MAILILEAAVLKSHVVLQPNRSQKSLNQGCHFLPLLFPVSTLRFQAISFGKISSHNVIKRRHLPGINGVHKLQVFLNLIKYFYVCNLVTAWDNVSYLKSLQLLFMFCVKHQVSTSYSRTEKTYLVILCTLFFTTYVLS